MRGGLVICIVGALAVHAAVLLFGGALFSGHDEGSRTQQVELLAEDVENDKADTPKPEEPPPDELKVETEPPPDPSQIVAAPDAPPSSDDAPALDAASLSALESALNGGGGGDGGFGGGASLASGGRIGGTGRSAEEEGELQEAFSMSEIDQRPRATVQVPGVYPSELRGEKVEGVASVIFIVDAAGRVTSPRVDTSTRVEFEKPALDAVRQWRFEPAIRSGERVPCRMRVSIRFQPK